MRNEFLLKRESLMNICVYCSSSDSLDPVYYQESIRFAEKMAIRGHALVFGGYAHGIMESVAKTVSRFGGEVVSVIPKGFRNETISLPGPHKVMVTEDIRSRKEIFEEISDAFVVLPGGIGTMDELFETLVRKTEEGLVKPISVLNINGCFDRLIQLLDGFVSERFMNQSARDAVKFFGDPIELLDDLEM